MPPGRSRIRYGSRGTRRTSARRKTRPSHHSSGFVGRKSFLRRFRKALPQEVADRFFAGKEFELDGQYPAGDLPNPGGVELHGILFGRQDTSIIAGGAPGKRLDFGGGVRMVVREGDVLGVDPGGGEGRGKRGGIAEAGDGEPATVRERGRRYGLPAGERACRSGTMARLGDPQRRVMAEEKGGLGL